MLWHHLQNMSFAASSPVIAHVTRYLDLADAIDEGMGGGAAAVLENADFVNTDVPYDFPLPTRHYVDEAAREEVGEPKGHSNWTLLRSTAMTVHSSPEPLGLSNHAYWAEQSCVLMCLLQMILAGWITVLRSAHPHPCPHLQARSFVLEVSMEPDVEQVLGSTTCERCGVEIYEAGLQCHACGWVIWGT